MQCRVSRVTVLTNVYAALAGAAAARCSYSDVAIYLYMTRGAGTTMATHQLQTPDGTTIMLPDTATYYRATVPVLDLLRAVTPLAWGRWITSGGKTGKYGPATAALYGNNKEW